MKKTGYRRKKVYQYDKEGNLLGIFESINKAASFFGVSRQYVSAACNRNNNNFCKGFLLSFVLLDEDYVKDYYIGNSTRMYTEKVEDLGEFVKDNIDKIDCEFSKQEIARLNIIKKAKNGSSTTRLSGV